ncbi:uncharacterized protein LAESUDRAFT_519847 [Laetiporus sulphureus 93-53]|uniref:Uncharacterized protein n=1 Tax=Laetiporus sulphureus 93-53 TaxID=1314785 RepID=A0A165G2Z8_9APHY|nr:uncharacterized protein LAESUDRAFT_519847 [Laetiporus sulphureus 93-53]KZT09758.1 hypothetical protein LAESUDRAFT_519847 [Laetiporus sulphureus 93-53]
MGLRSCSWMRYCRRRPGLRRYIHQWEATCTHRRPHIRSLRLLAAHGRALGNSLTSLICIIFKVTYHPGASLPFSCYWE